MDRVSPGGLEGLALDPGLLDGVVQRVGEEPVEVDEGLDGLESDGRGKAFRRLRVFLILDRVKVVAVGLVLVLGIRSHLAELEKNKTHKVKVGYSLTFEAQITMMTSP